MRRSDRDDKAAGSRCNGAQGDEACACGGDSGPAGAQGLQSLLEQTQRELGEARASLAREAGERTRAEFELRKLRAVLEHSGSMVFITDSAGTIEFVNGTFTEVTGLAASEMIGRTPCLFFTGDARCRDHETTRQRYFSPAGWQGTMRCAGKGGEQLNCKGVISPVVDDDGRVSHYLCVLEDVTEKMASSEKMQYLSHHDPVTGLLNRSRFIESLTGWIEVSGEDAGALFLLDIDQFKFISDTYGHGMGDEFLRRVGSLLQLNMRHIVARYLGGSSDCGLLARLSGDEFAIFAPSVRRAEAAEIAEQLRQGLECFYHADVPCHLTVSIGVALFREHGETTRELLTKADAAMYRAKDLGRNRCHIYSAEEREIEQMHMRLRWKEDILEALAQDRFEPWYQPIVDLRDGEVGYYEVLARMRNADGSVTLPGPFIDIAERFGLLEPISKAVLGKALERMTAGHGRLRLCMNISGRELEDGALLGFLRGRMLELGVDPCDVVFEVTETASIRDLCKAADFIAGLKEMGCQISLDDFGIGFTSFMYLRQMQVDFIKIAGPFIKGLEMNLNDQLFVKAITDVARGMGIRTIAEFVEDEGTLELLKGYGVDYVQGYLVGRPAPRPEPVRLTRLSG